MGTEACYSDYLRHLPRAKALLGSPTLRGIWVARRSLTDHRPPDEEERWLIPYAVIARAKVGDNTRFVTEHEGKLVPLRFTSVLDARVVYRAWRRHHRQAFLSGNVEMHIWPPAPTPWSSRGLSMVFAIAGLCCLLYLPAGWYGSLSQPLSNAFSRTIGLFLLTGLAGMMAAIVWWTGGLATRPPYKLIMRAKELVLLGPDTERRVPWTDIRKLFFKRGHYFIEFADSTRICLGAVGRYYLFEDVFGRLATEAALPKGGVSLKRLAIVTIVVSMLCGWALYMIHTQLIPGAVPYPQAVKQSLFVGLYGLLMVAMFFVMVIGVLIINRTFMYFERKKRRNPVPGAVGE